MSLISLYSNVQFGCKSDAPPPPPGVGECPECPTDPTVVVLCCPTPGNLACVLSCNNPILVKACGGVPPYSWFSDDEDFIKVTPVDIDTALVENVKFYFQYSYSLRYAAWGGNPCFSDPSVNMTEIFIKQVNKVYDCNMLQIVSDDFHDHDMVFDTDSCCLECVCPTVILAPPCGESFDNPLPLLGSGSQCAFVQSQKVVFGKVHSPLGLDVQLIMDGSRPWGTTDIIDTGVFGAIPRAPIDVFVYDSLGAFATLAF